MEGSQPAYPLVFLIFESLAFTASTLCPSSVTHLSQLLLRGVDVVHQGPGQVTELTTLLVSWTGEVVLMM